MKFKKLILTPRQRCDIEMLLVGAFNPLSGFLGEQDYQNVLISNRLSNQLVWPMPITLDVSADFACRVDLGETILLCDEDNSPLAYLKVSDKWQPDKRFEAKMVFNTEDVSHPGVNYLLNKAGSWYLGGSIQCIQIPKHYDFSDLRYTPERLKNYFSILGYQRIVGFQTRNPLHRAHMELTLRAAKELDAHILLHPIVGLTKPGDVNYYIRVRCYKKIMQYYPENTATLSLLSLAMRMGGPREALWHALIRKNYGCTHFIVGRDHAGPGNNAQGEPFYSPYAAQDLVKNYENEIGIKIVPFQEMVYVKERKHYCSINELAPQETPLTVSGTELRHALQNQQTIPEWFSFPEIIKELSTFYPPKHKQGVTLFFTGLSGAGKSTLASALMAELLSRRHQSITFLDGDIVRQHLTSELGFSKADRDLNIQRIGFVASEVTKAGGIVLCAAIAPYAEARLKNRNLISQYGGYIEIYVSTPLSLCEQRDPKGLYAKARQQQLKNFTGIDDVYEAPTNPELIINTADYSIEDSVKKILGFLQDTGYLLTQSNTSGQQELTYDEIRA